MLRREEQRNQSYSDPPSVRSSKQGQSAGIDRVIGRSSEPAWEKFQYSALFISSIIITKHTWLKAED